LCDGDFLLARLARQGASQQLPRTLAGGDDELEPVFLWCSFQFSIPFFQRPFRNVRMTASAWLRIARTLARSATTIAFIRSTHGSRSSLTTT
jgi:hypothetical protein